MLSRAVTGIVAVGLLLAACTDGGGGVVPELVREADAEWAAPNHDYANTRAASDSDITRASVAKLREAWRFEIPGVSAYGAAATNPLIVGNRVYFQDLSSNVIALDLRNGKPVWQKMYNALSVGPNGVALGSDALYAALPDGVAALSLDDGKELWRKQLETSETAGVDIQPLVFGDVVVVSTVPGNVESFYKGGDRGIIYALDRRTGDVEWEFDTVDSKNIWGNARVNSGGGAWYPPGVDADRGLMYFGIGNPAPWPGTSRYPNGTSRPGPNLYTNSVVALDAEGKLRWYSQVRQHDLFDLDFQLSPIVADATVLGRHREIVIGGGKTGTVVAFDREDGEVLWQTEVGRHENDDLAKIPEGETVTVFPGALGGVETPMAYADETVYVPVVNLASQYTAEAFVAESFDPGAGSGEIVAIDVRTGRMKWRQLLPSVNFGGATVVNDLVFTSTFDGAIYAFDRETGTQVWHTMAPTGINAWPAVAGDTIIIPAGVPGEKQKPVLIAYRLGAEGAPKTTAPSPTATESPSPTSTESVEGLEGREREAPAGEGEETLSITTPDDSRFDTDELRAPASTSVTVNYLNDSELPHNIHFFRGESSSDETLAKTDVETGPDNRQSVTFETPSPGRYLYICDVHPQQMRGFLVVT
ncbi:MAG TPA: PQQ-binding-like beta-propeller repeat protein [Actinomycetota bacterium]|nr:PQQ-binding-like beta-propeller repeat protein [Actinomycetota bacterium]